LDLVADIGATNARFQCSENGLLQGSPVVLGTRDFHGDDELLKAALEQLPSAEPERALLAIAGPATDEEISVTNTGLRIRRSSAEAMFSCRTWLVNDFFALAHGVPHFTQLEQLGGTDPLQATKALLGPGTGLGMAALICDETWQDRRGRADAVWQVLASEGGHADLAPGSHLETELWAVLTANHGHVCWETVLSGSGLGNLYAAMSALWGMRADELSAADITARGIDMEDPVCHQTLETFCALLGAAAGNLALTVAATGGVYIGGGIVPRMLEFARMSPLRRRFEERGAMSDFVRAIPLMIIVEPQPGLLGAARCLQRKGQLA